MNEQQKIGALEAMLFAHADPVEAARLADALRVEPEEAVRLLKKLQKKHLDFIVLNSLAEAGAGFGVDTNRITIIDREGHAEEYGLKPKSDVARDIADKIEKYLDR